MDANQKTLKFMKDLGIIVEPINKVEIEIDRDCEMAQVSVNGKGIMMGNFWDFHPSCHGFDLPHFSTYHELAQLFVEAFISIGGTVEISTINDWNWEFG